MLTEKENFIRILDGEMPEFIPTYDRMGWGVNGNPFRPTEKTPEGYDIDEYGMVHKGNPESMGGVMPVPGRILLDDITRWRDVIHTPDVDSVDWEKFSKEALAKHDPNNPISMGCGDYFLKLMNFMGVAEGLIALMEEPEECYAMMEYLADFYVAKLKKMIYYYKPDVLALADDIAAGERPFIRVETYRELVKPHHKRIADLALDAGMRVTMHCCGKCDMFIDDWLDMGVSMWEPAQVTNDLVGVKKKYGRKMAICGGWDNTGPISMPGVSDEELREALMKYTDTFAPDGGFVYMAHVAEGFGEEEYAHKMEICNDVYKNYARNWYQTH